MSSYTHASSFVGLNRMGSLCVTQSRQRQRARVRKGRVPVVRMHKKHCKIKSRGNLNEPCTYVASVASANFSGFCEILAAKPRSWLSA